VVSWEDLKLCMRAIFVPPHYRNELLLRTLLISPQEVKKVMLSQKNISIAFPRTLESELAVDSP